MPETIDDALMAALAGREGPPRERAFRELVARHAEALGRMLSALVADRARVEDLVQETFLRVYTARDRYQPGRAAFRTWLYRIGRNLALDLRRQEAHRRADLLRDSGVHDPAPGPASAASARQLAATVRAAVDRLPPDDRDVLLLRFDAELSYAEIAELTGASPAAVKQRVFRARKQLRALLPEDTP